MPINADQLEGYTLNNLIKFMFPIGSVLQNTNNVNPSTYITGTTWQLISSVALASEHIFGNGYNFALTNGTNLVALNTTGGLTKQGVSYGVKYPQVNGGSGSDISSTAGIGVPTKALLGNNLDYSGIIADTITVYTWERTA